MNKCPICGRTIDTSENEGFFLFSSDTTGEDVFCCGPCGEKMQEITSSRDTAVVRRAISYFIGYVNGVEDKQTRDYLNVIISNNAELVEDLLEERREGAYVERQWNASRQKDKASPSTTGWISGMRILTWLLFLGIIILGISIAVSLGLGFGEAFLVFILSMLIAFATVALTMVFLDMASDIRAIKNKLLNDDK